MDIQNRVVNYYKNNAFIQKYLTGIDASTNEIALNYNGKERRISIDILEVIKNEEELNAFFEGKKIEPSATPSVNQDTMVEEGKETLNDVKILVELKNKTGLDNILKKNSVNPSTGLIDINKIISTITKNTMNEVINDIKNGYDFDTDLTMYDTEGNYKGSPILTNISEDEIIAKSFNNVKLYLDASKMYPDQVNYSEEQISTFMKTYISKVKEAIHGVSNPTPVASNNEVKPENVQASSSAGFADVFVLTVIVLVYAVIITNLVLKLR